MQFLKSFGAAALAGAVALATSVPAAGAATTYERITVGGYQPDDDAGVHISSDGLRVAWIDNSGVYRHAYLRKRGVKQTVQLDVSTAGVTANGYTNDVFLSGSGTVAVFASQATNLDPRATSGKTQVYLRDIAAGTTTLLSVGLGGSAANGHVYLSGMSLDGTKILLASDASDLVPGDTNGAFDVFLLDRTAGTVTRVDTGWKGEEVTSAAAAISPDGKAVAFASGSKALTFNADATKLGVFVRTVATGALKRADKSPGGKVSNGTANSGIDPSQGTLPPDRWMSVSNNGRAVAFSSTATNLIDGQTTSGIRMFVRDFTANTLQTVDTGASMTVEPQLTADSSKVWFWSIGPVKGVYQRAAGSDPVLVQETKMPAFAVSSNGKTMVFDTTESLTPDDDPNLPLPDYYARPLP